ncbi:MAG: adenylate/guanylate cyclase domain-containing protein [Byssovorax sp.]
MSSLVALWERLSSLGVDHLGVDERSTGEARRVRLTNQSAAIGTVSCGSFAAVYAIAGPRFFAPMLANLIAVALLLAALFFSQRGARSLSKALVLVPVNLVVVVASMLLGGRVGFLYYLFVTAVVAFLLFSTKQWALRVAFALLSAACCVVALVVPTQSAIAALISPAAATVIDVASALCVLATVMIIVHLFTGDTTRAEVRLAAEHERSERLLLNILPGAISARLKENGEAIADGFANVTVLFADLVGFTELSQKLTPAELVAMLNRTFSAFDDLAERFRVEKIKTIGDCYMVAAGLPEETTDHVEVIARMALEMRETLVRINQEGGYSLRIRIGLHTGPVVAGVIGKRKFIYDLWGDTVNTASRMESSGSPGDIQVTREVADRLQGQFELEARGRIQVKGKGEMETFLLNGERAAKQAVAPPG